jgi:hypothetical protein
VDHDGDLARSRAPGRPPCRARTTAHESRGRWAIRVVTGIGMAEAGKSCREILEHYYPGSVVRKLW